MRRRLIIPALVLGLAACDQASAPPAPATREIAQPVIRQPTPIPLPPPQPPQPSGDDAAPPEDQPPARNGRLPLARILAIAQAEAPGEVIDVELEEDDDDDEAYEVNILTPEGRTIEMKIDARTGVVLEREED